MFGFSFSEVVLIGVVTLVAVGPQRLPGLLKNLATWIRKLRKMTTDVRQQTGIDELLRQEGLHGGLNELRTIMRGGGAPAPAPAPYRPPEDPYGHIEIDISREYPPEGPDAKGAIPDDLAADAPGVTAPVATTAPLPPAAPAAPPAPPASTTPDATPGTTPGATP
ncbi:MAG TPA: hypothetical protein VNN72_13520 [Polyangiaceae bacterium]|nr:hypothetical protein [Polyangiaceae bacterium]